MEATCCSFLFSFSFLCLLISWCSQVSVGSFNFFSGPNYNISFLSESINLDIEYRYLSITRQSSSFLTQISNGCTFIEQSEFGTYLGFGAHWREDALSLDKDMVAIWGHSTWVSEDVAISGPELDAVSVALVVLDGTSVSWREVLALWLDPDILLRQHPGCVVFIHFLQCYLINCLLNSIVH